LFFSYFYPIMKKNLLPQDLLYQKAYQLARRINTHIRQDVLTALRDQYGQIPSKTGRSDALRCFLGALIENTSIARNKGLPLCQDTGLVIMYVELGANDVIDREGVLSLKRAVEAAYKDSRFRASVVDPIKRGAPSYKGTADVHVEFTNKKRSRLVMLAKGFGSENKSKTRMFLPTASNEEVVDFIVDTVKSAGPAACPPFILGIGIGGTLDKAAYLAKKALALPINNRGADKFVQDAIKRCNELHMGILGLGIGGTVLGINMLKAPTHIAGLPVAVNIGCHSTRSGSLWL